MAILIGKTLGAILVTLLGIIIWSALASTLGASLGTIFVSTLGSTLGATLRAKFLTLLGIITLITKLFWALLRILYGHFHEAFQIYKLYFNDWD